MKRYLRHLLLPAVVGMVIFVGTCLLTPDEMPEMPNAVPWDKLVHFGMFFTLSVICYFDYYRLHDGDVKIKRWIFWCFAIPVIYGGGIELLQKYVFTARSAEWGDFIADVLGSLAATVLAISYLNRQRKLKKNISL
ncbi:MAG: VanZ family protein [Petrimonas sp.]|nr:VanZ family protein [Petrimonas sp.]